MITFRKIWHFFMSSRFFAIIITGTILFIIADFDVNGEEGQTLASTPASYAAPAYLNVIILGDSLIMENRIALAESLFMDLDKEYPAVSALYRALCLYLRMMEYENTDGTDEFDKLIEIVIKSPRLSSGEDPWKLYHCAAAYGLQGIHRSFNNKWFLAAVSAYRSAVIFQDIIDRYPKFYDACTGLGQYLYWRSVLANRFHISRFIDDQRTEAIKYLYLGLEKGFLPSTIGLLSLSEIFIEENRPYDAVKLLEDYLKIFPRSRILLWQYAEALKRTERSKESIPVYEHLLNYYLNATCDDGSTVLKVRWKMAELSYDMGDSVVAEKLCRQILDSSRDRSVQASQKNRIDKAESLLKKILQEHD